MIDIIKQTPIEYSAQSRDYQVLARLYTALFNVSKMYADDLSIWDIDIDNRLTALRASTLNFDITHSWPEDDLEAVTSCFKYLMRRKGILKTIEYCINILMKVQGIVGEELESPATLTNYILTIRVPENLLTLGILEDLLSHVLPAGLIFNIVKYKSMNVSNLLVTELNYADTDIKVEDVPYSQKMYIGPEKTISDENSTEWVQLKKDNKYWLGLEESEYVPDNQDGLEKATLVAKGDTGIENITLSKTGESKKTSIGLYNDEIMTQNVITDGFVYRKEDVIDEETGEVKYHEEWEND